MRWIALAAVMLFASVTGAAAQQCASNPTVKPDISGTYIDNFGGTQVISDSFWISGSLVFEICSVDNNNKRIVALNNLRDSFNPGKFSRFDWVNYKNRLWYCQVVFDAATEQAAASAPPPKADDPRTHGCGASEFEWTTLVKILP